MYPNCWLSGGQVSKRFRLQLEHNFLHFKLHNSILGVIYSKDYNTTPSTYVLSKGSQAYFNTSGKSVSDQHGKENLCFVKGVTDCAVK